VVALVAVVLSLKPRVRRVCTGTLVHYDKASRGRVRPCLKALEQRGGKSDARLEGEMEQSRIRAADLERRLADSKVGRCRLTPGGPQVDRALTPG